MFRRLLATTALLAAGLLLATGLAVPALAAPYPPSGPAALTASAYDPCAGASNILGGNGFQPGETVRLVLAQTGTIADVRVGADGSFRVTVTIPLASRGSDQVTATGLTSGRTAGLTLDVPCVVGQSSSVTQVGGGALASTGAQVGGAVLLGLVLFGAGTALVVGGRRRRAHRVAR